MQTIRGIYKSGRVELINTPPADVDQAQVLITFLDDKQSQALDLHKHGLDPESAADLRNRLKCFAEDWERPEMDAYDNL
jgi:hypothetical protein